MMLLTSLMVCCCFSSVGGFVGPHQGFRKSGRGTAAARASTLEFQTLELPPRLLEKQGFVEEPQKENTNLRPSDHGVEIHEFPEGRGVRIQLEKAFEQDGVEELCLVNDFLKVEYWAECRQLVVMMPTNSPTGACRGELLRQVANWAADTELGAVGDSSTAFTFPGGSILAPDVSFLSFDRLDQAASEMTSETAFYRTTPQFVIELLSSGTAKERSDVAEKMTGYMREGVDLGWVVDPFNKSVTIYRRKKRGGRYEVRSFSSSCWN